MKLSLNDLDVPGSTTTLVVRCSEPREGVLLAELESGIDVEMRAFRAEIATWASGYARGREGADVTDPREATADLRSWSRQYFEAEKRRAAGVEGLVPAQPPSSSTARAA